MKKILSLLAPITLFFLWLLIPVTIYSSALIFLSFLGGILMATTVYLAQTVWKNDNLLITVISGILSSLLFVVYHSIQETNYLEESGTEVTAVITEMYKKRARRTTIYSADVKFKLNGKFNKSNVSLSNSDYNSYYIGDTVQIYVDPENIDIAQLVPKPEPEKIDVSSSEWIGIMFTEVRKGEVVAFDQLDKRWEKVIEDYYVGPNGVITQRADTVNLILDQQGSMQLKAYLSKTGWETVLSEEDQYELYLKDSLEIKLSRPNRFESRYKVYKKS